MLEPLHSIRLNVLHPFYADIAREHSKRYSAAMAAFKKAQKTNDEDGIRSQDLIAAKAAIECIVFSALSLEAQIYDFAARYFGDSYAAQHLDKLDLVSKWLVVPRLVTGKEIKKDGAAFGHLRELVRIRNSLVHYKSNGMCYSGNGKPDFEKAYQNIQESDRSLQKGARSAISALDLLTEELYLLTRDELAALSLSTSKAKKHGHLRLDLSKPGSGMTINLPQ